MFKNILLIGAGGFIGSVARYFVSRLNLVVSFLAIPVGTLLVNVLGSFIIGFLSGIAGKSELLTEEWRLFLIVGICGGFTTFSTFTSENLTLLHNGQFMSLFLYTTASLVLGFAAVYLGYATSNII